MGTDECLARCGLTRATQPSLQHQPVVAGNANPSSAHLANPSVVFAQASPSPTTATLTSEATSTTATSSSSKATSSSTQLTTTTATPTATPATKELSNLGASGNADNSSSSSGTSPVMIALVVINGVLVVGLLAAALIYVRSRTPPKYQQTSLQEGEMNMRGDKYDPATPRDGASGYYDPYTPPPVQG